jgi:hypothetical protein
MSQRDAETLYLENLQRVLSGTEKYTFRLGEQPVCREEVSERYQIVERNPNKNGR